jgi:hypothetical protein
MRLLVPSKWNFPVSNPVHYAMLEHHPYYEAFIAQPTILAERAVPKALYSAIRCDFSMECFEIVKNNGVD